MNKLNSYVLLDKQAEQYNTPMFLANDAVAIRTIKNELMNPNSQISLSPEDFAIYKNGEYYSDIGEYSERQDCELIIEVADIQLPTIKEVK